MILKFNYCLQDEKNQLLITNLWLKLVSLPVSLNFPIRDSEIKRTAERSLN